MSVLTRKFQLLGVATALVLAFLGVLAISQPLRADDPADRINALEKLIELQNQKIEALTKKVQVLEQERTSTTGRVRVPAVVIDTNGVPVKSTISTTEKPAPTTNAVAVKLPPRLSVGADGFSMTSGDDAFALRFRGLVQLDSRTFIGDNELLQGNDSFVLRRARPIIEGTVAKDFDFSFVPDFGGSSVSSVAIYDAWLNYRYRPEIQFRAGKFKGPVGFESLQSDALLPFSERSMVSGFFPVRNVGVQLWGDVASGIASYAIGAFNGSGDARNSSSSDFSDVKEFAGRLSLLPFKQANLVAVQKLGFGIGGSYSDIHSNANALPNNTGGALPGYVTSGLQQFFAYNPLTGPLPVVADGAHWRLSPYLTYLYGPFGVLGEYAISHQGVYNSATHLGAELDHRAWEVSAHWVLTGEPASFTGITPRRPFNIGTGGWGAWQLVARYCRLDIDDDTFPGFSNPALSANAAKSWGVGINWWLNKNVRLLMNYGHTTFDGGGAFNPLDPATSNPPATVTHQDEDTFFTRLQLAF